MIIPEPEELGICRELRDGTLGAGQNTTDVGPYMHQDVSVSRK